MQVNEKHNFIVKQSVALKHGVTFIKKKWPGCCAIRGTQHFARWCNWKVINFKAVTVTVLHWAAPDHLVVDRFPSSVQPDCDFTVTSIQFSLSDRYEECTGLVLISVKKESNLHINWYYQHKQTKIDRFVCYFYQCVFSYITLVVPHVTSRSNCRKRASLAVVLLITIAASYEPVSTITAT